MLHKNTVCTDVCQSIQAGEIPQHHLGFTLHQRTVLWLSPNDHRLSPPIEHIIILRTMWSNKLFTNIMVLTLIKAAEWEGKWEENNERCNLHTYAKQLNLTQSGNAILPVKQIHREMRPRFRRMAHTWSCLAPVQPSGALPGWPAALLVRSLGGFRSTSDLWLNSSY